MCIKYEQTELFKMEKNDIKKWLYKNKPTADLIQVTKDYLNYVVHLKDEETSLVVRILIPLSDIGDASFFPKMESQLLIRWLI